MEHNLIYKKYSKIHKEYPDFSSKILKQFIKFFSNKNSKTLTEKDLRFLYSYYYNFCIIQEIQFDQIMLPLQLYLLIAKEKSFNKRHDLTNFIIKLSNLKNIKQIDIDIKSLKKFFNLNALENILLVKFQPKSVFTFTQSVFTQNIDDNFVKSIVINVDNEDELFVYVINNIKFFELTLHNFLTNDNVNKNNKLFKLLSKTKFIRYDSHNFTSKEIRREVIGILKTFKKKYGSRDALIFLNSYGDDFYQSDYNKSEIKNLSYYISE